MDPQTEKIVIDPVTRLEGHGKIEIFLNEKGDAEKAYFQIPEFRGFEAFCKGRPAEAMPQITSRICGVCPTAHHMASTKCLDDLFKVEPTSAARKIRELMYSIFMVEDHALHIYILGGPDLIVGPTAPKETRNVVGVIQTVGLDIGKRVIMTRKMLRELMTYLGGKVIHPVLGLPGGVAKGIKEEDLPKFKEAADEAVDFAKFTIDTVKSIVLSNKDLLEVITSDAYTHKTYYMGLVDEQNRVNFYDGLIRVVDPEGKEVTKFDVSNYLDEISEHVEPWSYMKFPYLKRVGWKGFTDGQDSGVYAVAPLARLNVADAMATPIANEELKIYRETLGGTPVHLTLANHWARAVELLNAAERMQELVNDPEITSDDLRTIPTETPSVGIGVVEAPRGTLIHHYETDDKGLLTKANLIVATQNNAARIALSVDKAATSLIKGGVVNDGLLNMVEMAFRAYDPCHACGTHSVPGGIPLRVNIYNSNKEVFKTLES
jgi:F420-non-reducing hydrogenase large subunit